MSGEVIKQSNENLPLLRLKARNWDLLRIEEQIRVERQNNNQKIAELEQAPPMSIGGDSPEQGNSTRDRSVEIDR